MNILDTLTRDYEKKVQLLSAQVNQSAGLYTQREQELKQHLANHNSLIGALGQAKQSLQGFKKMLEDAKLPAVPPAAPESNDNQEQTQEESESKLNESIPQE